MRSLGGGAFGILPLISIVQTQAHFFLDLESSLNKIQVIFYIDLCSYPRQCRCILQTRTDFF